MILKAMIALIILVFTIFSTYCIPNHRDFHQKFREARNIFGPNLKLWPKACNYTYQGGNKTTTRMPTVGTSIKKWQVGRVSRKQYEIINMLWRKTKIFVDLETTTYKPETKISNNDGNFKVTLRRPNLQTPTASYIEFYYLEEDDDNLKSESSRSKYSKTLPKLPPWKPSNLKRKLVDYPFLKFHINDSVGNKTQFAKSNIIYAQTSISHLAPTKLRHDNVVQNLPFYPAKPPINNQKLYQSKKYAINKYDSKLIDHLRKHFLGNDLSDTSTFKYETCPYTTIAPTKANTLGILNISSNNVSLKFGSASKSHNTNILTTIYDKIKFFEMYDRNTENDHTSYVDGGINGIGNIISPRHLNNNVEKVLLEHVDENIGHHDGAHKGRYAKKHVLDSELMNDAEDFVSNISTDTTMLKLVNMTTQEKNNISKSYTKREHVQKLCNATTCHTFSNISKVAAWTDYPFAAVYIYEPSQVRCDAAGISPHWLIISASCLSRHRLDDPRSEGRSAFVTYCGANWRLPERIAYVKFSLTHPKFHPSEENRRYMYNIGLIKVVSSMAACNGWSPISLMSHQYTTSQGGSVAAAVGWGLDRYVPRHVSTEELYSPLMVYESQIFTESCPGNYDYTRSKAKRSNDVLNINYVYCLSLPPYYGEKYDLVHGSLLLAGGKLIALYLQEERRPWGDQSAQYTSIWRLIPWVHAVAQEPDVDAFIAEI